MKLKSVVENLSLTVAAIIVAFVLAEAGMRIYLLGKFGMPFWSGQELQRPTNNSPIILDDELGWRATPNIHVKGTSADQIGSIHQYSFSSNEMGFRVFGDPASSHPKILVIGDSFTQATAVSDGELYYDRLGHLLNADIFAYGAGGYGTLQEYMILDRYIDKINPDMVLWQYSPNDIINNSLDLESASKTSNNGMIRPYLINGEIRYYLPSSFPVIRMFALKHSRLTYFVLTRLDMMSAWIESLREGESGNGEAFDPDAILRAADVTHQIIKKVRARVTGIPIVAFSTARSPQNNFNVLFKKICKEEGIAFVDNVGPSVHEQSKKGIAVTVKDRHWNAVGHRIAAESINTYIKDNKLLSKRTDHDKRALPTPR